VLAVAALFLMAVAILIATSVSRWAEASSEPAVACWDAADPVPSADEVLVYFTCEPPPADARPVVRRLGVGDVVAARLQFALEELLAGPTPDERELGYSSAFPADSQQLLMGVAVEGGIATIDFADRLTRVGPLNASHARFMLFAMLRPTVLQFDVLDAAELRIDRSCVTFARYFETDGCRLAREP
jgi:hypothetical protein